MERSTVDWWRSQSQMDPIMVEPLPEPEPPPPRETTICRKGLPGCRVVAEPDSALCWFCATRR